MRGLLGWRGGLLFLLAVLACDEGRTPVDQAAESRTAPLGTRSNVWLLLRSKADLSSGRQLASRLKAPWVHESLKAFAEASQAGLRARLRARKIAHRPFWIVNAVLVEADAATLETLRSDPDVERIVPDRLLPPPKARLEATPSSGAGSAWGVADIGAPGVWASYGTRGEGMVVASIDTGVDFAHAALVGQYRGRNADGSFSHDYNWFDPTLTCPTGTPCDSQGHGTHTVGTILGSDVNGGAEAIGVAPGAKWIAARACSAAGCLLSNLLAAGQWILAPTNLQGGTPRPDLRPNIVNNSWDLSSGGDPFYQAIIQAWVAAGIFPVFAAGNYGGNPGGSCGSVSSPADYPEAFAVGSYDASRIIAPDSGRGASMFGPVKPDLAAPGVAIRSAFPGGGYAVFSGTSMAAPHVAGTVALMWSAAPSLIGDLATTRALLADSAVDVIDLSCGGTASANDVWGSGRLDALEAVSFAVGCRPGTLKACGLRLLPSITEGGATVEGTLYLNGPAPPGGASVALTTDGGSLVTPPASVLVAAGAQSAAFSLPTSPSPVETEVVVRAIYSSGMDAATASLRLLASPTVQALAFNASSVTGGTPVTLTVTLSGPAPAEGAPVILTSEPADLATVPPSIAVEAGQSTGNVTITPLAFTTLQNKVLTVTAAYHGTSRTASLSISRTVPTGNALFDPGLGVPKCQGTPAACDTGGLVEGRAEILDGAEPHQPNTLLGQCADGALGSFHSDESVDRIVITPADGPTLVAGGAATVDVTVWCFDPALDTLQLFVADDARTPEWRLVSTQSATASGAQTLTVPVAIPNTPHPVFRAQWSSEAPPPSGPCGTGYFTDQDDVVLAFDETPQTNLPPTITATGVPTGTIGATASATFTVGGGAAPYVVHALVDGQVVATTSTAAAGDQVTFALSLVDGPHSLSATVTDSHGQSAATSPVQVTVDARPPTVELFAPKDGAFLSGSAVLRARASDEAGVAQVAFYADGRRLGVDAAPPYSFVLKGDTLWPGHHLLSAVAADYPGNTASTPPVDVVTERPGTVFFDDFNDGDLKGWTVEAGKWSVRRSTESPPRALYSSSVSGPSIISTSRLKLGDAFVDANVTLVSWSSRATLILAAHYQDRDNYDFLVLKGDGRLQLGRRRRGVSTTLATVVLGSAQGKARHLELRATGCDLEARADGIFVATARTDGSPSPGGAMLSVQGGAAAFDDVAVAQ